MADKRKFYYILDASREVVTAAGSFKFDPAVKSSATGTYIGTLALTDREDIEALEAVAKDFGVRETTLEDFEKLEIKKKNLRIANRNSPVSVSNDRDSLVPRKEEKSQTAVEPAKKEEDVDDVLTPKPVEGLSSESAEGQPADTSLQKIKDREAQAKKAPAKKMATKKTARREPRVTVKGSGDAV